MPSVFPTHPNLILIKQYTTVRGGGKLSYNNNSIRYIYIVAAVCEGPLRVDFRG